MNFIIFAYLVYSLFWTLRLCTILKGVKFEDLFNCFALFNFSFVWRNLQEFFIPFPTPIPNRILLATREFTQKPLVIIKNNTPWVNKVEMLFSLVFCIKSKILCNKSENLNLQLEFSLPSLAENVKILFSIPSLYKPFSFSNLFRRTP